MDKQGPRLKFWVLTIFDDQPPHFDDDTMTYLCYQHEQAPSTGTLHWQAFACFKLNKRITQVMKILKLKKHPHGEKMQGTPSDNRRYCSDQKKPGTLLDTFKEFGEIPDDVTQGKRNDLAECLEEIKDGTTNTDVAMSHPTTWVRNRKALMAYREDIFDSQQTREPPIVYICIGAPGSGKTNWASAQGTTYYRVASTVGNSGMGWFQGYRGEEVIIFDNVGHNWNYDYNYLMQIMDRYPTQVPIKGDSLWLKPTTKTICITSVDEPDRWFGKFDRDGTWIPRDISELNRRITETLHFERLDTEHSLIINKGVWNVIDKKYVHENALYY